MTERTPISTPALPGGLPFDASQIQFTPSGTGAVARSVQSKERDVVSVLDFFANGVSGVAVDPTGVVDSSGGFNAAALVAKRVIVPPGSYALGSAVSITSGQTWEMAGATFTTTTSTGTIFSADTIDDWALVGPFIISGNGSTVGTAKGISVVGCNRWRVDKYTCKTLKGWGLYVQPGTPSGTLLADSGQITGFMAIQNYVGAEFTAGTGAEYCTLVAPKLIGNNTNLVIAAGNVKVIGGDINEAGDIGILVQSGSNHAHGIVGACNINHNTNYNVKCTQVTNGQSFADCHIYGTPGSIWLDRCKGITFDGGVLDTGSVYNDKDGSSGYNFIRNMNCPGGSGDTVITDTGSGKDQLVVMGCYGAGAYASSIPINDPWPVYVFVTRAAGVTQSLTSGVAADLIFPTEPANGDRRLAYDNSTGIFTVPTSMTGQYRISATCAFTGTAVSATASFIELKVNGTARYLYLSSIFSTTDLHIQVEGDVYLVAADTIKLTATITGTTPTFGRTTYTSCMEIERIA